MISNEQYHAAVRDFRQARRRASLAQVAARLAGRPLDLLPYEDVLDVAQPTARVDLGVRDVPLAAIVGSVGRYQEFTRDFLPKQDSNEERWARVRMHMLAGRPTDPIDLYKLGEVYFVIDGNHRVSVSRELGLETIQAHVTEIETEVPVHLDDDLNELICRNRQGRFLAQTGLNEQDYGISFATSRAGQYRLLEARITRYQALLQQRQPRQISLQDAARYWVQHDYLPVIEAVREQGLLRDFPDRTETDLYVWLVRYRDALKEELGWQVDPFLAAQQLAIEHSPAARRVLNRVGERLLDAVSPQRLDPGPAPGDWRQRHLEFRTEERLFSELLVILSDVDRSDMALHYALQIARREDAVLHGSYIVTDRVELDSARAAARAAAHAATCAAAGVHAHFQVDWVPPRQIVARARWVDLVVAEVTNPPGDGLAAKLHSRFHRLIQQCPRPILAVPPQSPGSLTRALLAFDGSRKAREALYVAAYLADRWALPLIVLHVGESLGGEAPALEAARRYLAEQEVAATFIQRGGSVGATVLATARELNCDLVVMGGFGHRPLLQIMLGSAVETVLRGGDRPVLICR